MKQTIITLAVVVLFLCSNDVFAHPGSGIVVDRQGNVYFVDTGSGVYKIEKDGKLTKLPGPAYHWMGMDVDNRLKDATLPYFSSGDAVVTRIGSSPTLLLSSDFPITVSGDGSLYYPWLRSGEQLKIFRLAPSGTTTVFKALTGSVRWLNGIAATADGSIYFTENKSVRKISTRGDLTTVVENVTLLDCDQVPGVEADAGPYFRGIDVDGEGTVYVAASGCRSVVKIAADKKMTTILKTTSPWAPTGVAVSGGDLYVLEYLHTPGDNRREWLPRVKKITADGHVVIVATVER